MAESLSEVSSSMEGLEGSEEGKKKSKFKAFRNFFGKKKKKEPEDIMERRGLKPRFTSTMKPVLEAQAVEHKPKSSMGSKAISHDSVFGLEPEPEKSASKLLSSPETQRTRSRKIPPLRSRKLSVSPTVVRSEKVSKDLETVDDKTTMSSKRMSSSHCSSITRKSTSELSSDLDLSQSSLSSTQQLSGFSMPATSQGCLDSSAAKHKIAVNPRKQKRKKAISLSARTKQEEQHAVTETKEKATIKPKQADVKEKKDSTGPPSQEQSNKTETQDKKTRDQTLSTDAASSTGHSTSESHPRRRRRRVKNEWGIIEKSLVKSTQEHDWGSKAESSPSEELAGREHSFLKLYLEKQGTEQITTAEGTTPREMPSDKRNVKGKMADRDVEAQRTPAPRPTDVAESRVSGPPPSHEERSSEIKKKKDKAALLSQTRGSSTSQEEAPVSRTVEAQEHKPLCQVRGEGKETPKVDSQKLQPQMELSLERTTYHKERNLRGSLRAFSASVSSATTADDASMHMSPLPLRRWPNAGTISSDSKSTSEYESSSEVQPSLAHSFQHAWNPQDDDDVFLKSENVDAEGNKTEQSLAKARELPLDTNSSSEGQESCEEMTSAQSSQSFEVYEECLESGSFIIDSVSGEQLASRRHSETFQESEEKEVSTESSSYFDKYQSSEYLTSSEEELPPERSKQAQGQCRDQQEVSPVSRSVPKELSVSDKTVHSLYTSPLIVSPITQQQSPISVAQIRPVQPLPPSHTVRSWGSPQSEHQVFADPEGIAADWDIFIQPPSRPVLEQHTCAGPEIAVFEECTATQPGRYPSQSSMRRSMKKEIPLGAESAAFEGSHFLEPLPPVSMEPLPPQHHSQTPSKPFIQHQASAFERGVCVDPRLMGHPFQAWKQSFSTLESTAFEGNPSMEHVPPTLPQSIQQPYQNAPLESEAVAAKIISMGPLHTQFSAQSLLNPQSQLFSESTSVQGATLAELLPSQPSVKTKFQPQMTRGNVPASWAIPVYAPAPRMPSQPSMGSIISMEPMSARHPLQPWPPSPFEQVSASPDRAATPAWGIPLEPPAPRMLSQPLMGTVVQQPVSTELDSISVPQSCTVELMPSRFPFQPRVDPESYGAEEGVSVIMRSVRHHSQPPISTGFKEDISLDSMRVPGEWGIPIEPLPSKYAPQQWLGPEFEQQTSSLEGVAQEGGISKEAWLSRNPSQTVIKPQVQKTPSSFEGTSMEGGIPWKPLPAKAPIQFLTRSKVQEMSSHPESAVTPGSTKKAWDSRASSQSLVKFMAEQIFSESSVGETDIYAKPTFRTRSRPSRSLLKPKLEEQAFLYNWDDEPKEDTLKNLLMRQSSQSPRRPEEPQEGLSYSEGTPVKWSSAAMDVSQSLGKLEYRQKVSASASFPEEWKRSEGQLSFTQPSQAFDVSETLSTESANVEWSHPEEHQPPGQPFLITDYQQQVYLSSVNAAAGGIVSPKNTGSWSMPKCPDSPKKTMKYPQGYEDFIKSTSTSVTKPSKHTTVPAQKAFVSPGACSTEEGPQSREGGESPSSTSKAEVENVFGVRLRRISQKSGLENPDPFMPVLPASKESMNKGAPQGISGGLEKLSQTVSYAEKQGNRSKYEGTFKKPAIYRPPEKIGSWKADCTAEPAWINVAKQRQKGFVSQFPKKTKTRTEIKAEMKEPRYESKYDPNSEIPPKEEEPTTDVPSRMTSSSSVTRQEMPKLSKSIKSVGFDDQNMLHPQGKERETRRSSSLPPKFSPPEEPVWFSMAKKKAQAWSQMTENMQ
ncbi:acrosomal protein KIAA1210 homolog isoform X2 [Cricetulus griseus]|uniref:Acrosomal protein KIAA1210 homolog isoform X2 n=1 Tax=Cricetulus griseus TaxID=10029 RepID=A0A9J7HAC5_CRIGR|nr:acrosomal protein KIAA1210 homolog isoform X2 [Cricetulus griseus]